MNCPKCGSEMQEGVRHYWCMTDGCPIRWLSKDRSKWEIYSGHEEKVKR